MTAVNIGSSEGMHRRLGSDLLLAARKVEGTHDSTLMTVNQAMAADKGLLRQRSTATVQTCQQKLQVGR